MLAKHLCSQMTWIHFLHTYGFSKCFTLKWKAASRSHELLFVLKIPWNRAWGAEEKLSTTTQFLNLVLKVSEQQRPHTFYRQIGLLRLLVSAASETLPNSCQCRWKCLPGMRNHFCGSAFPPISGTSDARPMWPECWLRETSPKWTLSTFVVSFFFF